MKKYFICLLSFFLFQVPVPAQQAKLDSLEKLLASPQDTVKIKACHELFLAYEFEKPDKAESYLSRATALLKNVPEVWRGRTLIFYGYYHEDNGDLPLALKNYSDALAVYEKIHFVRGLGAAYNNLGNVSRSLANYSDALKYHFQSLKIRDQLGDKAGMADSYNNIGVVYYYQGNYEFALKYYNDCAVLLRGLEDKHSLGVVLNNIGGLYTDVMNYDKSLAALEESLRIKEELKDEAGISAAYNNLGNLYSSIGRGEKNDLKKRDENFEKALGYFFSSMKIKEYQVDKFDVATTYVNIGFCYLQQKKYAEAKKYLLLAIENAKPTGHKECLWMAYEDLSKVDSANHDYKSSFENYKMYVLYHDSIDNEATRKSSLQSKLTYEFEKKEAVAEVRHQKELENREAIAQEKDHKQNLLLFFAGAGLLLVMVFAGFIFRTLRLTRRQKNTIEDQKKIVEEQTKNVELQKTLLEEKQKEIIDSINYAKRIQRSQMPTERYIFNAILRLNKNWK